MRLPLAGPTASWEQRLLADLAALMDLDSAGVHLALMIEPYLGRVQRGEKTVESRWYRQRRPPFGQVTPGDRVVWKATGGSIRGWSEVLEVQEHEGRPAAEIVAEVGPALGVDDGFAAQVADRPHVLLVRVGPFHPLAAGHVQIGKRDRRGWVVLRGTERT